MELSRGGNLGGLSFDLSLAPLEPLEPDPATLHSALQCLLASCTALPVGVLVRHGDARPVPDVHTPLVLN